MNLLAATTLSTQRKAYCKYTDLQYIFVVQYLDDNNYKLMIYLITYPERTKMVLGKPRTAEKPHFEKQCSLEELKQFMEERGWTIDAHWEPSEDDDDVVG